MASNDGKKMTVFGLGYREHHTLHMQQILRQYNLLPGNISDRTALFTGLFSLSKELSEEEVQAIEAWLRNGGEFPAPRRAPAYSETLRMGLSDDGEDEDEEDGDGEEDDSEDSEEDEDEEEDVIMGNTLNQESSGSLLNQNRGDQHALIQQQATTSSNQNAGNTESKSSSTDIECGICAETLEVSEFLPSTKVTENCSHDHEVMVCLECLRQNIQSTLDEGALHRLNCPFCPELLSYEAVKKYSTEAAFKRYEYLLLLSSPHTVMCLGPNCGSGQNHTDETNPMMICESCSFKTCVIHKLPWHEGQTCEEFDTDESQIERLEEAEATAKLLAKEQSKICPNCHQGVTKQEGCDHLMCRCGKEWCFVCLASWDNILRIGGEAHAPTCTYHPRKVQMRRDQQEARQNQMTQMVHGGPVSDALERARQARNARIRVEVRAKALEAVEKRAKEAREETGAKGKEPPAKRRLKLHAPWEEK